MTGFSPAWLALREPFDITARAADLAATFLAAVAPDGLIVDLGAGAGSNIAWLSRRHRQHLWRHVDADPQLIAVARGRFAGDSRIGFAELDLARDLDTALDGVSGVTCAALLDLVSADWVEQFARQLSARRLPALIALTYDGRMRWDPVHSGDDLIAAAFHQDMRRDKGFGPALGPRATDFMTERLRTAGARLETRSSDWRIAPSDCAMLQEMIAGIARAALASTPADAARIDAWASARRAQLDERALALEIGHQDMLVRWA